MTNRPIIGYRPAPQEGEGPARLTGGADALDPKAGGPALRPRLPLHGPHLRVSSSRLTATGRWWYRRRLPGPGNT
ncbi:MAG: hypothetical protein WKG07_49070 [Hymenobacter sp.]